MLKGVHHVAIICSNYPRSKQFYSELLGLTIIAENFRAERNSYKLDLALPDGTQLELFSFPDAPSRPSYPEALGLRHLAFSVNSVIEMVEYLDGQGITTEPVRIDQYTGKHYTFFADPDGLPIELYEADDSRSQ